MATPFRNRFHKATMISDMTAGCAATYQHRSPARQIVIFFGALVLATMAYAQDHADGLGYQNFDPPNCGSFHTRKIQGTVTNQIGQRLADVDVRIFDDGTQKPLGRAKTDASGKFSISQRWRGKLRVVFFSDGYRPENWAVTITKGPDGGLFRPKAMRVTLSLPVGDGVAICRPQYSRK
jgi:Carboxypeptidase regulatory-like domain